jgi:hypothetical protein
LYRNGSNLATGTSPSIMASLQNPVGGSGNMSGVISIIWLDSPATTSSVTYAPYFLTTAASFQLNALEQNANSCAYTFMAQEIR